MTPEALAAGSTIFSSIAAAMGLNGLAYDDVLETLGIDPVGHGADSASILKDAYAVGEDGMSKMDHAADAVEARDNMSQNERDAYEQALKHPEKMTETTVKDLKMNGKVIVMADGSGGGEFKAKTFLVDLPEDTKVKVFTYTYEGKDGKIYQETGYIFDECANPAVDASADTVVPQEAPEVPPAPKPAVSYKVDPYYLDECGCDIKALLIADIRIPNADPESPESKAAIAAAIAEIQAAQKATGSDFQDYAAIRYVAPDGTVVGVECLEEGKTEPGPFRYVKANGNKVLVTPDNFKEFITGTLDNDGDGLVAPTMDAQFKDGKLTFNLPSNEEWSREQMGNIRADVMSGGSVTEAQFNAMLGTPIPADFFDWSFDKRVRWLQDTFNIPREAARDFANYLGSYTGDLGGKQQIIHLPKDLKVTPQAGDTFRTLLDRATDAHYKNLRASIS